jgi:penicillin-binding protein 2
MLLFDQLRKGDAPLRHIALGVLVGLAILGAGLWFVQILYGPRYTGRWQHQAFRSVRLPAPRGLILDRNGLPLADNRPAYQVSIYLEELRDAFHHRYTNDLVPRFRLEHAGRGPARTERLALQRQARYLVVSNLAASVGHHLGLSSLPTLEQLQLHYEKRLALPFPIATNLAPAQVARFQESLASSPALELEILPTRFYPYDKTAAHVLGYLQRTHGADVDDTSTFFNYRLTDYKGVVGIEAAFDDALRGRAGAKSVLVNSLGYRQAESITAPAEPGHNVILTLDLPIQRACELALRARDPMDRAAAVVLDVHSGDLLALASNPSLDPNDFIPGISADDWAALNDPEVRPLINRATGAIYPPGSILKIIVALGALDAGVLDPSITITNPGFVQVGKSAAPIHDTAPPGDYDFRRAFMRSSNTYFIHVGLRLGLERLLDIGQRLHLGEPSDLPTFQNQRGFFPTLDWIRSRRQQGEPWTDGQTALLCIGQGPVAVTPLQMAVMTAAIANGGRVLWPRLAQRLEAQHPAINPESTTQFPARLRSQLGIDPRHLLVIRDAMRADVEEEEGTGWRAAVPGLSVCGKTGTAEVKRGQLLLNKITWFVSFAPFDNPRYAVVVMVEGGASGGRTCAPIAQQIYRAIQRREAAPPTTNRAVLNAHS